MPQKNLVYDDVMRTTINLPDAKTLLAGYLNIRGLLGFDKLVISLETLDVLTNHLG